MPLNFCAIDFETANFARGSPCAVGLARVEGGVIVETRRLLMRPPEGLDWFDDFNIELHGITPAMVQHEPRFAARLPEILAFARGLPLVAHNAAFDLGVIRDACDESGVEWPNVTYACTLVLSRRTYDLLSYSLPWAAAAAGFTLDQHHDPEADALASAHILVAIAAAKSVDDLPALLASTYCVLGHLGPDGWNGCTHMGGTEPIPSANPDADPAHPFYGREIVFTGALSSMVRSRARELVAELGGQPADGVTRHTNILIIGYQDARKLRPGEELSAKARKARDLREGGQEIEVMPEVDFVQFLAL
jgi:DNA polymerase III, epsilon subunit and related 3''-5'' exonucleases